MTSVQNDPDRMLRPAEVRDMTGLGESTIWRMRNAGEFPAPRKISTRRIGYRAGDITAWLEGRTTAQGVS